MFNVVGDIAWCNGKKFGLSSVVHRFKSENNYFVQLKVKKQNVKSSKRWKIYKSKCFFSTENCSALYTRLDQTTGGHPVLANSHMQWSLRFNLEAMTSN
ncbi:unnamed protein product [Camellia sinensis]